MMTHATSIKGLAIVNYDAISRTATYRYKHSLPGECAWCGSTAQYGYGIFPTDSLRLLDGDIRQTLTRARYFCGISCWRNFVGYH